MKAVVYKQYGSPEVLHLQEVEKPVPQPNEVLVKIHATSVASEDCTFRQGKPLVSRSATGMFRPKYPVLGGSFAGVVEAVGQAVTNFKTGDEVFGDPGPEFGAYAEYISVSEDGTLALKPANFSFAEAVSVSAGALTSLPFLRDTAHLQSGQSILVNSASGSVGAAGVQLAVNMGAEVTAVCSTGKVELVKSLGASHVIDYTREDFLRSGKTYDVIYDTAGKSSYAKCKASLNSGGIYIVPAFSAAILFQMMWTSRFGDKKAAITFTGLRPPAEKRIDLEYLRGLCEAGKYQPVIDREYPLDKIIEAHRYVDKGHKAGSVIITMPTA